MFQISGDSSIANPGEGRTEPFSQFLQEGVCFGQADTLILSKHQAGDTTAPAERKFYREVQPATDQDVIERWAALEYLSLMKECG